jgi:hypothetical protein
MVWIPNIHWKLMLQRRILCPWQRRSRGPDRSTTMTTIHMSPGATVMRAPTHGGIERMTTGVSLLARLLQGAIRGLDAWRDARVAAHNERMLAELAALDPRVMAEFRAARDRARG